jgi:hypothetical protein
MATSEKKRAAEMEGIEGLEDDPENTLAKSFVELMIAIDRAQDAKRREMAVNVLDNFLEESSSCATTDDFDAVLQEHTLNWAQWNFFVDPDKELVGDPKGKWPLAVLDEFVKNFPRLFEKRPYFRDGRLFTNFVAIRSTDDEDEKAQQQPLDLKELVEAAAVVVNGRRKAITDADSTVW